MPYSPTERNRVDEFAFRGITGAASGIEDLLKKQQELETTGSYNDAIIEHAKANGLIGQEEYNKYLAANHQQKTGIAAGIAANIAQDWKRKEAADALQLHRDQLAQQKQLAMYPYQFAPTEEDMARARSTGGELLPTGKGTFHFQEYPESTTGPNGAIQVDPFVDPMTNKPVPGMGIVRKTGQIGYFGALLNQGGGVPIETDPKTGMKFYRDAKGNPKPLDPTKVIQSTLTQPAGTEGGGPKSEVRPTATPSATPLTNPQVGEVRRGYKFKGGDPAKQESWEKVGE